MFLKSFFSMFSVSIGSQISTNKEALSAHSFTLIWKLLAGSFIYVGKYNGAKIKPCDTPAQVVLMFYHWV